MCIGGFSEKGSLHKIGIHRNVSSWRGVLHGGDLPNRGLIIGIVLQIVSCSSGRS